MTERATLLDAVEAAYQEVVDSSRNVRGGDRLYEDLDLDSLAAMELLTTIEDAFRVDLVNDPRTAQLRTVDDLLDLLADAVAVAAVPEAERA